MNAEQLHRIVSKWPREAWPKVLLGWLDDPSHGPTDSASESAVMLFESAGLRFLIENNRKNGSVDDDVRFHVEHDEPEGGAMRFAVDAGGCNWYHGPTLIEAISAAISGASE